MKLMTVVFSAVLSATGSLTTVRAQMASVDQGIDSVEVVKVTATVEKIDLEKRKVSLLLDDGKRKTYKVDKSVQNLDQVRVGDHLSMAYTEELVILVGKSNETPGAGAAGEVAVAPKGAKPGMVMTETTAVSAKILAVNAEKHSVTLEDPDGKKKTVKLGKKTGNLDQLKVGDTVDMVLTDSLVVEIVK
jgi:translation elongation factor P/translation initiation factor 5A